MDTSEIIYNAEIELYKYQNFVAVINRMLIEEFVKILSISKPNATLKYLRKLVQQKPNAKIINCGGQPIISC